VALVSGWNIGPENPSPLAVQLLVDYITGSLGGPNVRTPRCTAVIVYGYLMVVWVGAGYWHNSYSCVARFVYGKDTNGLFGTISANPNDCMLFADMYRRGVARRLPGSLECGFLRLCCRSKCLGPR
jgi:hypothetical protein